MLEGFLEKYSPEIAREARTLVDRLQSRLAGANLLVYDNYNALAIGFGPSDRASAVVLSVAVFPRWISLFFMRGTCLEDPAGLLRGKGGKVRHIPHVTAASLDHPAVDALISQALGIADPPIDPNSTGSIIIKSVSKRQRPRRAA